MATATDRPASVEHQVYTLIYDGITHASETAKHSADFIRLAERERIAACVFNTLRAAGLEVRLPDHQPRHAADLEER